MKTCYQCEKPAHELNNESRCIICATGNNRVNRKLAEDLISIGLELVNAIQHGHDTARLCAAFENRIKR